MNAFDYINSLKELTKSSSVIREAIVKGFSEDGVTIFTPEFVYRLGWKHNRFDRSDKVGITRRQRNGDPNDPDFINGEGLHMHFEKGRHDKGKPKGDVEFNNWKGYNGYRHYRDAVDLERAEEFINDLRNAVEFPKSDIQY